MGRIIPQKVSVIKSSGQLFISRYWLVATSHY